MKFTETAQIIRYRNATYVRVAQLNNEQLALLEEFVRNKGGAKENQEFPSVQEKWNGVKEQLFKILQPLDNSLRELQGLYRDLHKLQQLELNNVLTSPEDMKRLEATVSKIFENYESLLPSGSANPINDISYLAELAEKLN